MDSVTGRMSILIKDSDCLRFVVQIGPRSDRLFSAAPALEQQLLAAWGRQVAVTNRVDGLVTAISILPEPFGPVPKHPDYIRGYDWATDLGVAPTFTDEPVAASHS